MTFWQLIVAFAVLVLIPVLWINFWLLGLAMLLIVLTLLGNRLWLWRAVRTTRIHRNAPEQAFQGDLVEIEVIVHNGGRLPLPWLQVMDYVPSNFKSTPRPEWLLSVRSQEKLRLTYTLECLRRGRYHLGPLEGKAGTLFDTSKEPGGEARRWEARSRLLVYPKLVPLEQLLLPSRLPMGNLRTRQPLLPDPSRIAGLREYQSGDDPRYIDWRSTARFNQLMVKQFERTRQVPLAILVDMRPPGLQYSWRQMAETSIIVAASLAYRANELHQPFGLYSNGYDPGWDGNVWDEKLPPEFGRPEMPPRNGTPWLYEVLDKLAGLETRVDAPGLEHLIGHWSSTLPWGATVALVGFEPYPALVTELSRLRRAGFTLLVVFAGANRHTSEGLEGLYGLWAMGIRVYDLADPAQLNVTRSKV